MRAARQHTLSTLAIYSFLESEFSESPQTREQMRDYLMSLMAKENADVTVSTGP
jgi:hypothetical protein